MKYIISVSIIIFIFCLKFSQASTTVHENNSIKYCTYAHSINFNPFNYFNDTYQLTYLLLTTRSYISNDPDEPGLLEKWAFIEDGKIFRGKISNSAIWQDGTKLTPSEAAIGIAYGFKYREISNKLRIKGIENYQIQLNNWNDVSGIKIINESEFEIHFDSSIENLIGVIKEALSTNTRLNRVWPYKTKSIQDTNHFDLIGKYKVTNKAGRFYINFKNIEIELKDSSDCIKSDIYASSLPSDIELKDFSYNQSSNPQAFVALINNESTATKKINNRKLISNWLRNILYLEALKRPDQFKISNAHFDKNEPGYRSKIKWHKNLNNISALPQNIVINTYFPKSHYLIKIIDQSARKDGIQVTWTDNPLTEFDISLIASRIVKGRQIWLQDILQMPDYKKVINNYPLTKHSLTKIREQSSLTVPVKIDTLYNFEDSTLQEYSIVPLVRSSFNVYTSKNSPVEIIHTTYNELKIRRKINEKDKN